MLLYSMYVCPCHMLIMYIPFTFLVVYFDGVIIHMNTIRKYLLTSMYKYIVCKNILKKYQNAKYSISL